MAHPKFNSLKKSRIFDDERYQLLSYKGKTILPRYDALKIANLAREKGGKARIVKCVGGYRVYIRGK